MEEHVVYENVRKCLDFWKVEMSKKYKTSVYWDYYGEGYFSIYTPDGYSLELITEEKLLEKYGEK